MRGWRDSESEGQVEKPKRKKRRAVTTAVEHELEEGGHFHATHLGQPGTCDEEPVKVRRKQADTQPKEKKKKAAAEKESKAEVRKTKLPKAMKEEKPKDKREKKRKKDHAEYPEAYGMMGQAMLAPMMGMMRSMSYPMMSGMMMMPGSIIGAPLMGGPVGHMGLHGTPMAYSLPAPMVRALPKAPSKKAEEKRRRFTEAPAAAEKEAPEEQEQEKRSASVSSSSSSTSEAKNEGPPTVPTEPVPAPACPETLGEGELELGLISPPEKEDNEEHSPLQVPPGMESPVASPSPDAHPDFSEVSRLNKPSSWVEVEGETMEELQRELEVTCQNKPCASIATQTDELPTTEDLSEGLAERWFLGFVDAAAAVSGTKESSASSSSDEEDDATCRPERQLRRRSRSQSAGIQGPEAKASAEAAEASSSSSSSSSSSGPRKRQRAPSSDEEATKATQSLAPPPVDPRRLRMVQDYSDVA